VTPSNVNEGHDAAEPTIAKRVKRNRIRVACPGTGPACAVTLVVKAGKKRLGRAHVDVRTEKARTLKLPLSRKGMRLLKRRHRLKVTIVVTVRRADLVSRRTIHATLKSRPRA
jgi:hypothetical protein